MKAYKNYMDDLSVNETLHEKIMNRLEQKSVRQRIVINSYRKYIAVITSVAVVLVLFISIYPYRNISNIIPDVSDPNIPSTTGNSNELQDEYETITESGAVCHDIDASQLIRQMTPAKVPFGFVFSNKLTDLIRNDSGIMNNGVRWKEQQYTEDDLESNLQILIKDPVLPDGDYTVKRYILVEETTENIIAYRTVYYYFDKNTLGFQNSFSFFYFAEQHFKLDELEQMKNVSKIDGEISISDFPEQTNVHVKIPHVRKLIYLENGISIVIEAEADAVLEGNIVDVIKSLERYEQIDKQLIDMMKSLIE